MEKEKFKQEVDNWLNEVLQKGNEFGEQIGLDFYPFQSSYNSLKPEVDLMIIGANPGGEGGFHKRNSILELFNGGEQNAYIENPQWKISKPILEMFSSENLRKTLEDAVVMNVMYFNSSRVKSLEKYDKDAVAKAIKFCAEKTRELIGIIKPKAILLLGFDAPKWLGINFSGKDNSILRTKDDKSALIMRVEYLDFPCYIIHHTSGNPRFNTGDNLLAKKAKFEEMFLGN